MKKTLRSAMLSTICMLVVAVMSLTGVTYAWFSAAETATVGGMEVSVGAAGEGFMVSEDGTNWSSNVDFTGDVTKTELMPVSTVDAKKFYSATVKSTNGNATTIVAEEDAGTAENGNVVSLTFFAKNTNTEDSVTIYLEQANIFSASENSGNKEAYNAARMALLIGEEVKYIWGAGDTNYGVQAGGEIADCNTLGGSIGTVTALKTNLQDCNFTIAADSQVTITLLLWIEGQDAQCINKNAADTFNVNLGLTIHEPAAQG